MSIFRRLSTFKKKKMEDSPANGNYANGNYANGHGMSNGNGMSNSNGTSKPKDEASQTAAPPAQASKPTHENERTANRADVESTFQQFGQLIHASRRPLPTQSGDGAYLDHEAPTGLVQDLKTLGFKDYKTLTDVIKSKASGELLDDKTYVMERVIQVRSSSTSLLCAERDCVVGCGTSIAFQNTSRLDQPVH